MLRSRRIDSRAPDSVLAGANGRYEGDDDGLFSALEIAGLDLSGTHLAVLSACETGLGEVLNGKGVYGLRRALVMAGAESQLISLWNVSSIDTQELMGGYYGRLSRGEDVQRRCTRCNVRWLLIPRAAIPIIGHPSSSPGPGGHYPDK